MSNVRLSYLQLMCFLSVVTSVGAANGNDGNRNPYLNPGSDFGVDGVCALGVGLLLFCYFCGLVVQVIYASIVLLCRADVPRSW